MSTPSIVLLRPEVAAGDDPHIAEGMRVVWACALEACGATSILPRGVDVGCRSSSREAGEPHAPKAERAATVATTLVRDGDSARIIVFVQRWGQPLFMRGGRTFRGATAQLRAMAATLHTIAYAASVDLPTLVGWRDLTFCKRSADGLEHLRVAGRELLARAHPGREIRLVPDAVPMLH